ncbi:MAG: exosome complex protein Rrp42 [Candidatus Aenigmarchaeota archaeon]|nr:exosome complex protein Rrp42 [Candidatus Aenigmarchaeota archaeon]
MISLDRELMRKMAEKGKRIDNRSPDAYREITIENGIVTSAEGSSMVKIGNTQVIAGVKLGTGAPFPDTPDEGVLMVAAELLPLASPEFEPGPPGEQAIELSRVVDRAIRESKAIDFPKLCITPKEKVWMVYVDIDVLDDDGNLIDAACLAAVSALLGASLPELDEENSVKEGTKSGRRLPMEGKPVSNTFAKINGRIIADPKIEEMNAADARLTIGSLENGMLCSLQKGGPEGFTFREIETIMEMAEKKGAELRAML